MQGKKLGNLRARTILFKEIADDALAYSKAHKRSYRDDVSRMTKLVEMFGNSPAKDLDGHEMEQRLDAVAKSEQWAASTFNHYRSLLMLTYREALRAKKGRLRIRRVQSVTEKRTITAFVFSVVTRMGSTHGS